jgi:uncharacterized membrane protein
MTEKTTPAQARPDSYHAVLTPHRSLEPRGFLILMSAVAAVSFAAGLVFLLMGAWPVFGFFGLDVALIYLAFRLNYRAGRLYETIELTPARFLLTRVHPSGKTEQFDCNPYWASVRLLVRPDGRTDLRLVERGRELAFGRFLNDDERRGLARELRGALLQARNGARI